MQQRQHACRGETERGAGEAKTKRNDTATRWGGPKAGRRKPKNNKIQAAEASTTTQTHRHGHGHGAQDKQETRVRARTSAFLARFFCLRTSSSPNNASFWVVRSWFWRCASSRRRCSTSRTLISSSTVFPCPIKPAPFSTRRLSVEISVLSFWMVSLAFTSFS